MNPLEQWIAQNGVVSEKFVMNQLQDNGVVSDNCVSAADVCDSDCVQASAWLEGKGE